MPIKSAKFALFLVHTMHSIKKRVQNYYFFFTCASVRAIFFEKNVFRLLFAFPFLLLFLPQLY